MADTIARSHLAHSSIRAQATRRKPTNETKKNKPGPGDRQSVKAVLGSPWTVQWEGEGEGEDLVGELCGVVDEIRVFHGEREKRRRATNKPNAPPITAPSPPPILNSITFGLNETIKQLERARLDLEISVDALLAGHAEFPFPGGLIPTAPAAGPSRLGIAAAPPPPRIVFVCVHDINPRELVEHVPRYVASWNALLARSKARLGAWLAAAGEGEARRERVEKLVGGKEMWCVPLRKGSEQVLAHAVGLRRVSVMGVTNEFSNLPTILSHLESTPLRPPMPPFPIHALAPSSITHPIYSPTLLKAIHTSIPADPKARKARRVAAVRLARDAQKRRKREEVERTRRTIGWKVGGRWWGGSEQKKRDRRERWEGRKRVEGLVRERKRKKAVKEKTAKRGQTTLVEV